MKKIRGFEQKPWKFNFVIVFRVFRTVFIFVLLSLFAMAGTAMFVAGLMLFTMLVQSGT